MKYLDIASFNGINSFMDNIDMGESIVSGSIEAYSCKTVGSDRKLYKEIEHQISMSKSPKVESELLSVSPFGPLNESASKKTFMYLIATLNASYFDYDFSQATPEQFRKEPNRHMITNSINTSLAGIVPNYNSDLKDKLWSAVDMEVEIQKADIYSYIPDLSSDPFTEDGVIWSFNYFFYNRALKRIIFFKCRSFSKSSLASSGTIPPKRSRVEAIEESDDEPTIWAEDKSSDLILGEMEFDTTSILI